MMIQFPIDHMPHRADSMAVEGPSRQTSINQPPVEHQQPPQQQDHRYCHVAFVLGSECSQAALQRYIHFSRLISEAIAHEEAHRGTALFLSQPLLHSHQDTDINYLRCRVLFEGNGSHAVNNKDYAGHSLAQSSLQQS